MEGIDRLKASGADIVLVDPQYVPARAGVGRRTTGKMVTMIGKRAASSAWGCSAASR